MIQSSRLLSFVALLECTGLCSDALAQKLQPDAVMVKWRSSPQYNGSDNQELNLVLKNTSTQQVQFNNADLWFNAIYPVEDKKTPDYEISCGNGNLIRIRFEDNLLIAPQDSLVVSYQSRYPVFNISTAPNGFYFQDRNDASQFFPVEVKHGTLPVTDQQRHDYWASLYDKNTDRQVSEESRLILPTPKSVKKGKGSLVLTGSVSYWIDTAKMLFLEGLSLQTFQD